MRGLDHSWIPIHLAIGWVLTRDRAFVDRLPHDGSTTRPLSVAIATAKAHGTKADAVRDGWLALRDAMLIGKVRAQGTPCRRHSRSSGVAVEAAEGRQDIPASEIASANLQDNGEYRDCLIPKDWHASGAPFYRDLHVSRGDLLAVFRPPVPTVKDETGARKALADRLRGKPMLRRDAWDFLIAAGFKISERAFLYRVWPQARSDAGLPEKAPPGRRAKPSARNRR